MVENMALKRAREHVARFRKDGDDGTTIFAHDNDANYRVSHLLDYIDQLEAQLAAVPKVTVTDRWAVVDATGKLYGTRYSTQEFAQDDATMYDRTERNFAPHTVRRVALVEETNG